MVYHDEYNKYDLGLFHPLIGDKPRQTMKFFEKKGLFFFVLVIFLIILHWKDTPIFMNLFYII
jgi:hypothetical protein